MNAGVRLVIAFTIALATSAGAADVGGESAPDPHIHHVLVNQVGYNSEWPKRFTAPISPDGSRFELTEVRSGRVVATGEVKAGVGDFTAFDPQSDAGEYVVRVVGGGLAAGTSFPFRVGPKLIQRLASEPALRFMIDSRSIVGTHPSAYGGCPWRDGNYYTFEVPSLVLLYMSQPAFFDALPAEIDFAAEKRRVLDPAFNWVRADGDADALGTARHYFQELDPPVGGRVPDIVRLIHWGIGWYLIHPKSHDPTGDVAGNRIHDQTVEQFAFYLYAHPTMQQYFTPAFHQRAHDFAFDQWEKVGLLKVNTKIGDVKGRSCPGHSIFPNLLMYEVAGREGRDDARRFLDAAVAQAQWVVETLDPANPKIGKGQRISEHKLITGLALLAGKYSAQAPPGLRDWLGRWAIVMTERSDNMYDFRKYDRENWTVPKPYNEPGNIAAFPAIALAVAAVLPDGPERLRLRQIAAGHFDNLFGRNPLNAAGGQDAAAFPGIDRPWPVKYPPDLCARLELCRGTLNSCAATEHYPFQPQAGGFRHSEGWVAFNADLNVGLAYAWGDGKPLDHHR